MICGWQVLRTMLYRISQDRKNSVSYIPFALESSSIVSKAYIIESNFNNSRQSTCETPQLSQSTDF